MSLTPPILSLADPVVEGEGSIDPFGTGAAYERLAERILPYVTARMSRPRFLTAMVVGANVCTGLEDRPAADGTSPAWLVFEWYVVEAHARSEEWSTTTAGRRGIAGIEKVSGALRRGQQIGHSTYLKTPKVFGFTGIYKRLSEGLEILTDDLALDEGGYQLFSAWESEQGLRGFASARQGRGARLRKELRAAVEAGLEAGHTCRPNRWGAWESLVRHMRPDRAGTREARWLFERLRTASLRPHVTDPVATEMRREMIDHIVGRGSALGVEDETKFLRGIAGKASRELRRRLGAIDAFEMLCQPLEDVFRLILHLSTRQGCAPTGPREFADHALAIALHQKLQRAAKRVRQNATLSDWEPEVQVLAERYDRVPDPEKLFDVVLRHHEETQREKPPDGKRAWFEPTSGGRVIARQQYARPEPPVTRDAYVHPYRVASVSSFLRDLRKLGR